MVDAADFDTPPPASENNLDALKRLAEYAGELNNKIGSMEDLLKQLRDELNDVKFKRLPELMTEVGLRNVETSDGTHISLTELVTGNLPADLEKRREALEWIEANGGANLIKYEIDIRMPASDESLSTMLEVEDTLKELDVQYTKKEGIHAQTLCAWVRERLKAGEDVPFDKLNVFSRLQAKIEQGDKA